MKFQLITKEGFSEIRQISSSKVIAYFIHDGINELMAGDYVEFLNDKYCDKEVNMEWPGIDRDLRIKHHLEQIKLLEGEQKLSWNEHGNAVE